VIKDFVDDVCIPCMERERQFLHDRVGTEDHCTSRFRIDTNYFLSHPRPLNPTHDYVHLVPDSNIFTEEDSRRQEGGHKDEANDDGNEDDSPLHLEVKDVVAAIITEKGCDTVYPARRVKAQWWLRQVTTIASFDDKANWDEGK
jgi:hypothetical protein